MSQDREYSEYSEERRRQIQRRRMEERRRRRRKKRIIRDTVLLAMFAALVLVIYGVGRLASFLISEPKEEPKRKKQTEVATENVAYAAVDTSLLTEEQLSYYNRITALEAEYPQISALYADFTEYPSELLELVLRNQETIDFVKNYPMRRKINVMVNVTQDYTPGEIPHFIQWDERWGYASYGDSIIAISGCGPVCLSMVAVGLTGNTNYHPKYVAELSENAGYYSETGTSWSLMTEGAAQLGLTGYAINITADSILNELNQGHPIIASMMPGDFTVEGHFIVLTGTDGEGKIVVNDPNSKIRSEQHWDTGVIMSQSKSMWAYTV